MKKILDEIVIHKRAEVAKRKELLSLDQIQKSPFFGRTTFSLAASLTSHGKTGIIAEFKRQSPSKGIIHANAAVDRIPSGYADHGACGVSVLTDIDYFGGSDQDFSIARNSISIPLLRKDFTVDAWQIYESKMLGADVILLIAAILTAEEIKEFSKIATDLGMEVLLELHGEDEFQKIPPGVRLIGINNRNLQSFEVSVAHSIALASKLPDSAIKIAESGIDSPETLMELKQNGFDGFLIGERFMKESDPVSAFMKFNEAVKNLTNTRS